jgi:hypothetical protein
VGTAGPQDLASQGATTCLGQASLLEMPLRDRFARLKPAVGELYLVLDRIEQTTNICERATLFRSLHAAAETLRELRMAYSAPEASPEFA